MALKLSPSAATAMLEALIAAIDAAVIPATLNIYGGAEPANPTVAVGAQPLLVSFAMPDPSFEPPTNETSGVTSVGNVPSPEPALVTGTATWGRIIDGDGNVLIQGNATDLAGGGQFKLTTTSLQVGIEVSVVEMIIVQPRGY